MTRDEMREYFEHYIEPYMPYRESNTYKALMNHLVNRFYEEIYINSPDVFRKMFEDQEVPQEIFDNVLVNLGMPQRVILELDIAAKITILTAFSDFQKYKSTIGFIENIGAVFYDRFALYELYLDKFGSSWIFRPKIIYKSERMEDLVSQISWSTVSENCPGWQITRELLNSQYDNEELILPLKTNIVYMRHNRTTELAMIYMIIITLTLNEVRELFITIFFLDNTIAMELNTAIYLWYYLLTRYHNGVYPGYGTMDSIVFDAITIDGMGGWWNTPGQIPSILAQYDALENVQEVEVFYNEFFDPLRKNFGPKSPVSVSSMELVLGSLDSSVKDYVLDRLSGSSDEQSEISSMLSNMFSSLKVFFSPSVIDEITYPGVLDGAPYVLNSLPQISYNAETTPTYQLFNSFKPYHTELIAEATAGLVSEDKMDLIYQTDEFLYYLDLVGNDTIPFPPYYTFDFYGGNGTPQLWNTTSCSINEDPRPFFTYPLIPDEYNYIDSNFTGTLIEDSFGFSPQHEGVGLVNLSDYYNVNLSP